MIATLDLPLIGYALDSRPLIDHQLQYSSLIVSLFVEVWRQLRIRFMKSAVTVSHPLALQTGVFQFWVSSAALPPTIVGLTELMTAGHSLRNVSPLHELILFQLFDSSVVWLLLF